MAVDHSPSEFATAVRRWLVDADWIMQAYDVSRATIYDWVRTGVLPEPITTLGGARLWDVRTLEKVERPKVGRPPSNTDTKEDRA